MGINIRAAAAGNPSAGSSNWSLSQFAPGTAAFWTLLLLVVLLVAVLSISGAAF